MTSDLAIDIRGLRKTYAGNRRLPPRTALHGVDLAIPRGMIYGLLGPNGAGKSTMINIMAGLVTKTAGQVSIMGADIDADPRAARSRIGVVPQEINMDPFFTPRRLLDIQAGLYGVPAKNRRTDDLLELVGLTDKASAYARTLSGGMRRRLMVAKAMVHNPPVLVLDEPTAGVDVELRQQLWDNVRALNRAGTTILLTTHYLEEAEALCERIAIINHGNIIADEDTKTLLRRMDSKDIRIDLDRPVLSLPATLTGYQAEITGPARITVRYSPAHIEAGTILTAIQSAGYGIRDVTTFEPKLEDVFLHIVGATHHAHS